MEASNESDWGRDSYTNIIPTVYVRPIRFAREKKENETDNDKVRVFCTCSGIISSKNIE